MTTPTRNNRPTASIERDIFQRRMVGVAEEMSAALRRSAFSSMIWDMYDYSCAVFTPEGRMLAQAETIAAQLGIMEIACARIAEEIPIEDWEEGDIVVCNDPYKGCTHTPDVVLFSPVFSNSELVALTSTIAHHVDIGGKSPCTTVPDNIEVFGEGLIFPPLKLARRGQVSEDLLAMLGANVRNPQASLGDLRAQIAGCRTGEQRCREIVERYGAAHFSSLSVEILDYGEQYLRTALAQMGNAKGAAEILIEDGISSDEPIVIRCTVQLHDGEVDVDFAGTSDQRANALNCPYASTLSMVAYAVKTLAAPDIAQNGGCFRPINVKAPAGSVLNPRRPGAVGSRHYSQQAVAEVVLKALAPMASNLGISGSQIAFPALKVGGFDTRAHLRGEGEADAPYFAMTDIVGGGGCATSRGDGINAVDTHGGNCQILAAEVIERISPIRVKCTELVANSGGRGQFRGGLAVRRDYEMLCDGLIVNAYIQQTEPYAAPWGNAGGENGGLASIMLNPETDREQTLPCKAIGVGGSKGTVVRLQSSGGGGYGPIDERDPRATAIDRESGFTFEA